MCVLACQTVPLVKVCNEACNDKVPEFKRSREKTYRLQIRRQSRNRREAISFRNFQNQNLIYVLQYSLAIILHSCLHLYDNPGSCRLWRVVLHNFVFAQLRLFITRCTKAEEKYDGVTFTCYIWNNCVISNFLLSV